MLYFFCCGSEEVCYEKQTIETLYAEKVFLPFLYAEVPPLRCDVRAGVDDLFRRNTAVVSVAFFTDGSSGKV
jgi:hypothetical protein